jgi:beta-xylosidase
MRLRRQVVLVVGLMLFLEVGAESTRAQPADDARGRRNYARVTNPNDPQEGIRLSEIPIHDPFIVAHKPTQTYYLYTSARRRALEGERSGVVVYKSKDLKSWSGPRVAFAVPDDCWANPRGGAWAPEVHEYRGRWYLVVTLHNREKVFSKPPETWRTTHMRGTIIAESDSVEGPFKMVKKDGPHTPERFMALDGTLYIDRDDQPWMVYCHEWIQLVDGTVEAIKLKDDLSDTVGQPRYLFKGSDAWWNQYREAAPNQPINYVTDGPQLYRSNGGELLMLWSSYKTGSYQQTLARSKSGRLAGPWEQLDTLVGGDSGHGMLFETLDGQLMLVLHQPFRMPQSRAKFYQMSDEGYTYRVIRARPDLYAPRDENKSRSSEGSTHSAKSP